MILIWILLTTAPSVSGYNYLVFDPLFGHSHTNFVGKVADTLTDAGHNVTVLMPVCDPDMKKRTGLKSTKDVIILDLSDDLMTDYKQMTADFHATMWVQEADPRLMFTIGTLMAKMFSTMCKEVITRADVITELKSRHFDAGIAEPFPLCGLGLFEVIGIPATIAAASTPPIDAISQRIGQPTAPSWVPSAMSAFTDRMSLYQRAMNLIQSTMGNLFFDFVYEKEHSVFREQFGQDFHSTEHLLSRISFQFINTNPYVDFPFPTIQKNVAVGGIAVNLNKDEKLSEEWDRILSLRPRTVLISFGSVAHSCKMPDNYKTSLLEVFQSIPDTTFIWKYEDDTVAFAKHVENVHLAKWVPQNALLADSRLSMFLTHGGLGSTTELAHMGKPAVMIPLFGDQPHNAVMLSKHGGVEILSKFDLAKPDIIKRTFQKVLNDRSYSENAQRLAEMLQNQPISAKQLLVKHSEFAARFGKLPNLDPYGRQLGYIQYYLLDVLAIAASIMLATIFVIFYIAKRCIRIVRKVKTD